MKNKSTYALLLNAEAEEKGRSLFELCVYGLVLACMTISGWQFASTAMGKTAKPAPPQEMIAEAPVVPPAVASTRG